MTMPRFGVDSGTSRDTTIDGRVNFTKLFRDFTLSIASLLPKPVLKLKFLGQLIEKSGILIKKNTFRKLCFEETSTFFEIDIFTIVEFGRMGKKTFDFFIRTDSKSI